MKLRSILLSISAILLSVNVLAQNQQGQEPPKVEELAEKETKSICDFFKLEYYQEFLVDSVLQYNMKGMMDELEELKKSGAMNQESYQVIYDKWLDRTTTAYEKIFNEEQWKKFMKSTYGKDKKKRDERIAKLKESLEKNKK